MTHVNSRTACSYRPPSINAWPCWAVQFPAACPDAARAAEIEPKTRTANAATAARVAILDVNMVLPFGGVSRRD
jgi:hypothetical protein